MKLAFCLFKYFPYGGLQSDFLCIARECLSRTHEVHVYTMHWEGPKETGLIIHIIPTVGLQNHTRARYFAKKVKTHLAKEKFDAVIGFNKMPYLDFYYAADVCYQARASSQSFLHKLLPRYHQLVAMERAVFSSQQATEILLISPKEKSVFIHYYATQSRRFHLLPPGIRKDRFALQNAASIRMRVRSTQHIAEDEFLLLLIGSGFKTKGLDRALRGIAALPDTIKSRCHFLVIGQDDARKFKVLAAKLNLSRVKFLGGRNDVADFILAADILLHPAYHENTGTVLLEAMVAGLPVLTVANCGYAHYVQTANAGIVLSEPFSQAIFNATLQKMLSLPDVAWRENGLSFSESADIFRLPEKAIDIIEKAVARRDFLSSSKT